jgi:hypothetical protein
MPKEGKQKDTEATRSSPYVINVADDRKVPRPVTRFKQIKDFNALWEVECSHAHSCGSIAYLCKEDFSMEDDDEHKDAALGWTCGICFSLNLIPKECEDKYEQYDKVYNYVSNKWGYLRRLYKTQESKALEELELEVRDMGRTISMIENHLERIKDLGIEAKKGSK